MSTNMRLGLWSASAGLFFTFLREILKLSNVNKFLLELGEPGENTIALMKTLLPYSSWIGLAMLAIGVAMIVKSLARKVMRLVVGWTGGSLGIVGTIKNIITSTVEDAKIDKWFNQNGTAVLILLGSGVALSIVILVANKIARKKQRKATSSAKPPIKDYYDTPIENMSE